MANCNKCKAEIAWKQVYSQARRKPVWVPHEPQRDEQGQIVYASKPNGKDDDGKQKLVRRAIPTDVRHECKASEQVPAPSQPTPAPTPEPQASPCCPECGVPTHIIYIHCSSCRAPHLSTCSRSPHYQQEHPMAPAPAPEPQHECKASLDVDALMGKVRSEIIGILDEYGVVRPPARLEVTGPKATVTTGPDEIVHPMVPILVTYLSRRIPVYLHGPAGSGKTFGARQALRLIGLDSTVVTMPGMSHAKVLGYEKLDGKYLETAFLRAYREGGGLVLDEFDRMLPQVASAFNSILENGTMLQGDTQISQHADFAVVATGNTDMRGATRAHTAAQPLDYATAARFVFLHWGYDDTFERARVLSILKNPRVTDSLLTWVRSVRGQIETDRLETVLAGPRESARIAADVAMGIPLQSAAESWIWRGLNADTVRRILARYPYPTLTVESK